MNKYLIYCPRVWMRWKARWPMCWLTSWLVCWYCLLICGWLSDFALCLYRPTVLYMKECSEVGMEAGREENSLRGFLQIILRRRAALVIIWTGGWKRAVQWASARRLPTPTPRDPGAHNNLTLMGGGKHAIKKGKMMKRQMEVGER